MPANKLTNFYFPTLIYFEKPGISKLMLRILANDCRFLKKINRNGHDGLE